jgi:hypothetical protein
MQNIEERNCKYSTLFLFLTPCTRRLLQILTFLQLKRYPASYWTHYRIHMSPLLDTNLCPIYQSTLWHPTHLSYILILSSHERLDITNKLFPSNFQVRISALLHMCYVSHHPRFFLFASMRQNQALTSNIYF